MAGGSLLALLDDISTILDDVALMTKMAAKKTTGVVGDDLALNANQVAGVNADRELPVVWAVAKGSMLNKVILVPLALLISYVAPFLILPALMIGGLYLCYEGGEKIIEKLFHKKHASHGIEIDAKNIIKLHHEKELDVEKEKQVEKSKIKGAIKTDFVLSAEIIVIALGTVAAKPFLSQALVLSAIGIGMTVGVYGLVAAIVKADDFGLWLINKKSSVMNKFGEAIVNFMPKFMKVLTVVGTVAMFAVGGSILAHGLPFIAHFSHGLNTVMSTLLDIGVGLVAGALSVGVMELKEKVIHLFSAKNKQVK